MPRRHCVFCQILLITQKVGCQCPHFTGQETEAPGSNLKSQWAESGFELKDVIPKCRLSTYTALSSGATRAGPLGSQFGSWLSLFRVLTLEDVGSVKQEKPWAPCLKCLLCTCLPFEEGYFVTVPRY